MATDYHKTASLLIEKLGGEANIVNVSHCATRLRFVLKDTKGVDKQVVSKIPGVITAVEAGGQFQVVIGNHVRDVYQIVTELLPHQADGSEQSAERPKVGFFSRIIDIISGVFAPFLYPLAACGILQGILSVLVAMHALDTEGGTYRILNFISWTAFTFLPVLIAITAAKKFGVNQFVSVIIACALVSPDYIAMVEAEEAISFLGIPVQLLSYTSSVIPIILAIWVASYVERFFNKILPMVVRNLFSAMFTIVIMVPLTLLAFGPIGNTIGGAIGGVYNYLYGLSPIIAGAIVGGFWEVLVIFGVHWGITPVSVSNYSTLGYDTFTGLQVSAVFAQAGAALGVCLKTKNTEMKKVSASAAVTGLFGITEPAIYGVNLRLKKPMVCGCIAGAVGGAIAGAFGAVSWSYNIPGIATIPAFFKAGYMTEFVGVLISIAVSFVLGGVLTYVVGFADEPMTEPSEGGKKAQPSDKKDALPQSETVPVQQTNLAFELFAPVSGTVIPVSEVKDELFASETLGKGIGILPDEGRVRAPFDGRVEMCADTAHAVGLRSDSGCSVLLHIGIDTVKLKGKGFQAYVKEGDLVKKGQLLIEFDRDAVVKAGYDPTVVFIVTEQSADQQLTIRTGEKAAPDQPVMVLHKRGADSV